MELTDGHLLGGRLHYAQPRDGYRTGIEPVLLAACVPARPGDHVLEAGTGAAAGLLCLLARVPSLTATAVELDPAMADLARRNLAANGKQATILTGDVTAVDLPACDHAFANPPWHDARATASPDAARRLARQTPSPDAIERWIAALARLLGHVGTLSLILPAPQARTAAASLRAAGLAHAFIQPLAPKLGRPAKLAIVQARKTATAGVVGSEDAANVVVLDEIVLHQTDGAYTPSIEAVLRGAEKLPIGELRAA